MVIIIKFKIQSMFSWNYDFNMFDSFGDGWNGGTYDLSTSNGNIGSGGLLTGSTGTDVFTLANGDPCVTR